MGPNLDSVEAKLQRADQHIQSLQDEIAPWMAKASYIISPQVNADSTRYSLVAHLVGDKPPLQRWTLIAGDSLHNLRCALDHLVYAIAVHESGTVPPPDENKLMFPITDTSAKFRESSQRIRSLSAPVRQAIEEVQPYNRPHPDLPPLLGVLRDLENIDKHRLLQMAYAAISEAEIEIAGVQSPAVRHAETIPYAGEIKNGTEVFAIVFDAPNPNMGFIDPKLDLAITLWHGKRDPSDPPWHDRNEVHAVLTLLAKEVRQVVNTVAAAVR
jgi:hypothetical protein